MCHLRMKLYAVQFSLIIPHCGAGTVRCSSDRYKSGWNPAYMIRMAHPAYTLPGNSIKKLMFHDREYCLTVLAGIFSRRHFPTGHERHQLIAVAYPQNRYSHIQYRRIIMRGSRVIDTVWSACKNNPFIPLLFDLIRRNPIVWPDLGINVMFPHPSRDQLVILPAEIQNQYFLHE